MPETGQNELTLIGNIDVIPTFMNGRFVKCLSVAVVGSKVCIVGAVTLESF